MTTQLPTKSTVVLGLVLTAVAPVLGQSRFLVNNRSAKALNRVLDANGSGDANDPGENNLFFSLANASAVNGPQSANCLGVNGNGAVFFGDVTNRAIYRLCDMNHNANAQDAGEAVVFADQTNASGRSLAVPSGIAFDSLGRLYVTNAGNANGPDVVWRIVDLDGNGNAQGVDEITEYVGAPYFGAVNGPHGPQKLVFDDNDVLYVRDSASGNFAILRFEDLDQNGRADDAGEAAVFLDSTNASGVTVLTGLLMDLDRSRPHSLYTWQTATGGVKQLVRATDLNNDGDAQDAGEAAIVYTTSDSSFTAGDVVGLADGDVLIADGGSKKIFRLHDGDNNGDFNGAGERTEFFSNVGPALADIRHMSILPVPGDVNLDGVLNQADVIAFINVLLGVDANPRHRLAADVNKDGTPDGKDVQQMTDLLTAP